MYALCMHACIHVYIKKLINLILTHHLNETNVIHAGVLQLLVGVHELYIDFMQSY